MINVVHVDGHGRGVKAKINGEGETGVVVHPHPPKDEEILARPYRQRFSTSAGSSDMTVDGSSTAVDFYISPTSGFDSYIKVISVIIGDGGSPALNKFGNLSALANGVEICYTTQDLGTEVIHDGIKTNLEFIRLGTSTGAIGTGTDAYLADVSGGGTEKSYIPTIDLAQTFGLQNGIRLRRDSNDKMVIRVRDDLTGLSTMDVS